MPSVFSYAQLEGLWVNAGGDPAKAPVAAAVGEAESSGSATAQSSNPDGGTNVGIWQLDTPGGKALYRQRSAIIEPVFAQLFARLGRHLNYRDTKVDLELHLWAASHNLLKSIRAGHRNPGPAITAPAT